MWFDDRGKCEDPRKSPHATETRHRNIDISSVGAALKILRLPNRMNKTKAVRHLGCFTFYLFPSDDCSGSLALWFLQTLRHAQIITKVDAFPCCSKEQPCEHLKRVKLLLASSKGAIAEALSPSLPHELSKSLVCKFPGEQIWQVIGHRSKN